MDNWPRSLPNLHKLGRISKNCPNLHRLLIWRFPLVAAANKKGGEANTVKVETEEIETIGKKGAEFEHLEVKAVEAKEAEQDISEKIAANAD